MVVSQRIVVVITVIENIVVVMIVIENIVVVYFLDFRNFGIRDVVGFDDTQVVVDKLVWSGSTLVDNEWWYTLRNWAGAGVSGRDIWIGLVTRDFTKEAHTFHKQLDFRRTERAGQIHRLCSYHIVKIGTKELGKESSSQERYSDVAGIINLFSIRDRKLT
ncbi:hypothetical protein Tco_0791478 [Tanacetum coccineum]